MGEASHLSHAERKALIQTARRTLDDAGFTHIPIIAGTGAGSTRETLDLSHEAAAAGADYVIVITSGYFAGALTRKALKAHFVRVANESPLPVIIYNCARSFLSDRRSGILIAINICADPGASSGIDLDSDLITELAEECPNTCGVKLTYVNFTSLCALIIEAYSVMGHIDVGTLANSPEFVQRSRNNPSQTCTLERIQMPHSSYWAGLQTSFSLRPT